MAYINHSRYVDYVKTQDLKNYEMKDMTINGNCRVWYDQDNPRQPRQSYKCRNDGTAGLERRIAKRQDM